MIFRLLLGCGLLGLAACNNVLTEFGKQNDDSLLFDAQSSVDQSNWTSALTTLAQMSPAGQARRQALDLKASAYAGRCGLNFLTLATDLQNIGSTLLFLFLMKEYKGAAAAQIADCEAAETAIKSISAPTNDEYVFLLFLSFAKIGVILAKNADIDQDGVPDGTFNACSTTSLSDLDAGNVATAVANAQLALAAISASVPMASGQLTNVNGVCADLASNQPALNFCAQFNPNVPPMTANQIKGIRSLIQANQYVGLGTCNNTLANCLCP